jgi:HTH-type transcriptional regulator/antitoxin HigA
MENMLNVGNGASPGNYIRAELQRRGWTQEDLARIMNKPLPTINRIIQGKHSIVPETAVALGIAFGTGAQIWLNRQSAYELTKIKHTYPDVERRAAIYHRAPVKDMVRRGWIRKTNSIDELEKELSKFFEVESLAGELELSAAARSSLHSSVLSPSQRAWCYRAKHLAKSVAAAKFDQSNFEDGIPEIRKLAAFPEQIKELPRFLSGLGVRLVIVEHLHQSKIDGATLWLDDRSPVIALSVRYDRIDCFWHTLCHECAHIKHRDKFSLDDELVGEVRNEGLSYNEIEARAEMEAASLLIPEKELKSFVLRQKPIYAKSRIIQFAHRIKIHPGIITGQLQHLRELTWDTNREMLVKIRYLITSVTLTDGWGVALPAN